MYDDAAASGNGRRHYGQAPPCYGADEAEFLDWAGNTLLPALRERDG